jgi:hypothetical protein
MGKKTPAKERAEKKKKQKKSGGSTKPSGLVSDLRQIVVKPRTRNRSDKATRLAARSANTSPIKAPAQAGMHTIKTADATQQQMSFYFPFTPQQLQYSNIGPELSEIQRPGKTPIIAFNRFKARQIALKITLAVPQDGLFTAIDDDMEFLFKMANSALPVYFTNMDKQVSNQLGSSTDSSSPRLMWSIIDLNFASIRRNADNQVTVAEANLTLVENMNPIAKIADLPVITYSEALPVTPRASGNKEEDYLTITQVRQIITTDTRR